MAYVVCSEQQTRSALLARLCVCTYSHPHPHDLTHTHSWSQGHFGHRVSQVCRGTAVMLVVPTAGMEEIANPFVQPEEAA